MHRIRGTSLIWAKRRPGLVMTKSLCKPACGPRCAWCLSSSGAWLNSYFNNIGNKAFCSLNGNLGLFCAAHFRNPIIEVFILLRESNDNGDTWMKRKKAVRNILLFAVVPLALIALIYLFVSLYYTNRFYNGTWINGVNFSNKTVEEAKESLKEYKESYILRIIEPNGDQEVIKGSDIDYAATFDKVDEIKQAQGIWRWILAFADVNFYTVESSVSYSEEKLEEAVKALNCVSGTDVKPPVDAYVEFTDEGVKLVPEVVGTQVDEEKLLPAVREALDAGNTRMVMDDSCYVAPKVTTQSREIREIMAPVEKIQGATITYTIGEATEVLDSSTTNSWICQDENGAVTVDSEKVTAYVEGLASQYDTLGGSRQFVATGGNTVTVPGGNYGWKIDVAAEADELAQLLINGESQTREPIYSATAARHGGNEIGNTYIEISIDQQHMWFYKDGALYADTNIVTGTVNQGYDTPRGSFKVLNRYRNITLEGTEKDGSKYSSPVDYWIGFYRSGYGIHDASWRGDNQANYGGSIYISNGSHGCVNTPYSKVKQIFDAVTVNTPVLVY